MESALPYVKCIDKRWSTKVTTAKSVPRKASLACSQPSLHAEHLYRQPRSPKCQEQERPVPNSPSGVKVTPFRTMARMWPLRSKYASAPRSSKPGFCSKIVAKPRTTA
eukprot:scaffold265593_cov31-Tisochrysis_lutea.AAC.2